MGLLTLYGYSFTLVVGTAIIITTFGLMLCLIEELTKVQIGDKRY